MKFFQKSLRLFSIVTVFTLILASCIKPDVSIRSELKVVNLSPNSPALDYFVDSVKVNKVAGAFGFITPYNYIESGKRNFRIKKSGREILYLSDFIETMPYEKYTAFVYDSISAPKILSLNDSNSIPAFGKAHIRFVNVCDGAPNLDLYKSGPSGTMYAQNVSLGSAGEWVTLDTGRYNIEIRVTGTTTPLISSGFDFKNQQVYYICARGFYGSTTFRPAMTQVRTR